MVKSVVLNDSVAKIVNSSHVKTSLLVYNILAAVNGQLLNLSMIIDAVHPIIYCT